MAYEVHRTWEQLAEIASGDMYLYRRNIGWTNDKSVDVASYINKDQSSFPMHAQS